jgi:hypothetical protein
MRTRTGVGTLLAAGLAGALGLYVAGADDAPRPAERGTLVVVDARGKEHKLKSWTFKQGTRRLSWLAAAPKAPAGKKGKEEGDERPARGSAPAGPEALVVRDELKIHFSAGVVTLVSLDRVRSVEFDNEKGTITVRAATGPKEGDTETLTGSTRYEGINKVVLEADVDKGEAGVASLTFRGGSEKGIRAIRFPAPAIKGGEISGRPAVVQSADGEVKRTHKVRDLTPLYLLTSGQEKLLPTLPFKKTLKLDVGKVKKIARAGEDAEETTWQVTTEDDDSTLTLLPSLPVDGKPAVLVGLLGRVPAGYKLFPVRRIAQVDFDTTEEPKEKDKAKEKEGKKDCR